MCADIVFTYASVHTFERFVFKCSRVSLQRFEFTFWRRKIVFWRRLGARRHFSPYANTEDDGRTSHQRLLVVHRAGSRRDSVSLPRITPTWGNLTPTCDTGGDIVCLTGSTRLSAPHLGCQWGRGQAETRTARAKVEFAKINET